MRIIGHLDMDAFFAAIEERDHPEIRGRPVVVGADPAAGKGRGVVSTANYPARIYGIHSAMPISTAWKLAEAARRRGQPATVFTRGNYPRYREVSDKIMAILRHRAPVVEVAGIDEAYFDLSFAGSFAQAADLAFTPEELQERFGAWGPELYARIRGRHDSPLVTEREPKSVGEQETFAKDTKDLEFIFQRLWELCREVHRRFRAGGFHTYRTVVVTVRFADFATFTRSHTRGEPAATLRVLIFEAMKLLMPFLDRQENPGGKLVRLIGVRVEKLAKEREGTGSRP